MKKTVFQIIFIMLLTVYCPFSFADVSGKMLAYACYSCHGEKLINLKLSQPLSTVALTQTLLAFKNETKSSTIMNRITKGYSDTELTAVANYISQ